jgi:hypothetical protein
MAILIKYYLKINELAINISIITIKYTDNYVCEVRNNPLKYSHGTIIVTEFESCTF